MTRTTLALIVVLQAGLVTSAPAAAGQAPPVQPVPAGQQPTPTQSAPAAPGGAPAQPAAGTPVAPQDPVAAAAAQSYYKLQPSDIIDVKYRYTPEYNATVSLRPDGFITLPIVGEVKVAGLTVTEARHTITDSAAVRLRDPEITIELRDFQKPRFVVGGQVGKPGQFELRGRVTVLEAVAMAGGFTKAAKHSQVVLYRRFDEDRAVARLVNAKRLEHADAMAEDPVLLPGDFLFVPQNRISKVERFVPFQSIGWIVNILVP